MIYLITECGAELESRAVNSTGKEEGGTHMVSKGTLFLGCAAILAAAQPLNPVKLLSFCPQFHQHHKNRLS